MMTTKRADIIFSIMVRVRDPKCVRCGMKNSTDNSHFYERAHSSTRYNLQNCDGVCRECHQYWHANPIKYRLFKLKQLGTKDYMALQRLEAMTMQRSTALENFEKLLK